MLCRGAPPLGRRAGRTRAQRDQSAPRRASLRITPDPAGPTYDGCRLVFFEQCLDIGALGLDRLEKRHMLPAGPAVDDGRKGDPAAVALAQIAGDPAYGAGIVQCTRLQRHAIEPGRAALAQKDEWSVARHHQSAVERRETVRIVILVG